ncbi:MAG: hypothetical protein ACRC2U_07825 [Aeromonas sp.]
MESVSLDALQKELEETKRQLSLAQKRYKDIRNALHSIHCDIGRSFEPLRFALRTINNELDEKLK